MNKKGFTLVELLAAIVILGLLTLITVPAVTKIVKDNKNDLYLSQLQSFRDSAKAWGADNMFSNLPDQGNCILVQIKTLQDDGLVEPNVKNPKTGEIFNSKIENGKIVGTFVKIENSGSEKKNKYEYEIWDCDNSGCYTPDNTSNSYPSSCTIYTKN